MSNNQPTVSDRLMALVSDFIIKNGFKPHVIIVKPSIYSDLANEGELRCDMHHLTTIGGYYVISSETIGEDIVLEPHTPKKDAEIAQLKACRNGDCDRFRLGAEPCTGCHIQTAIDKINSLQSLVKELADTLQKHLRCSGDCEGCMLTKLKYECKTKSDYELVRKAREVCK